MKWASENLSCEKLDEGMIAENSVLEEEEKCILRMQRISYELDLKFMNLDPAYIDEMSERIFQMLYEDDDSAKGDTAS